MKKNQIILFVLVIAFSQSIYSQTQKLVLCETFTGEDCPPSAQFAPFLDSLLNNSAEKVVTIKYFLPYNWGNTSKKPFYYNNTYDVDVRSRYYSCYSIPTTYTDGKITTHGSYPQMLNILQTRIDSLFATKPAIDVKVNHSLLVKSSLVKVHVVIKINEALQNSNYKLQVAVIERELNFTTPPGTNGETHFEGMMKKMLPDANGTSLNSSIQKGDSIVYDFSWKFGTTIYDISQLAVVAFVQDSCTKNVLQAAYSSPHFSTAVEGFFSEEKINIYPNPFTSNFTIQIPNENIKSGVTSFIIYDINGREIMKEKMTNSITQIERKNLSEGIYFYRIINDEEIIASGKISAID